MPAIGITGGVATGKSTFSQCLCELMPDAQFFDADRAARSLTGEDPEVKKEIGEVFGAEIYSKGGDLNRGQLRAIITKSAAKRKTLEQILHPRIRRQWSAEAQSYRNSPNFFLADIPLLYETGGEKLCDRVVVVACSPEVQLARLRDRDSSAKAEAMELIKTQMSLEEKIRRADHVVWNNDGREVLSAQANDLVKLWRAETWTQK